MGGFLLLSFVVSVQLLYPAEKSLPFAKVNNNAVGFKSYEELAGLLITEFINTKIELYTDEGVEKKHDLMSAGAELKVDSSILKLNDYALCQIIERGTNLFHRA